MKKIALIKLPSTYANWFRRPVLGLSSISAYLEQGNLESEIFDAGFHGWSESELTDRIVRYGPDAIGITAMTHEINMAAAAARTLKGRLDVPVVVGGPHVTALPERTLSEFPVFDFGITGEGEKTFLELLQSLSGNHQAPHVKDINGLVLRDGGRVIANEPRPFLTAEELERLPYPAFHHYYGENRKALSGKGEYYVMFSARGCPYRCAFCMQVLGNLVRGISPERICREIEYAVSRYGAHTIDFADEIFLFNNHRTRQTLQMMIDRGLSRKIQWSGLTRANMVDEEIVALAKKSGCCRLEMGVESGDDAILESIGKKITVAQARNAVRIIKASGIPLVTYYILGQPNETGETARKTVDLAVELNTDAIAVGIMTPYPGTDIYRRATAGADSYRLLSENWSDYDKYGGRSLELKNITYRDLIRLQKNTYLRFYLKNFRFLDLIGFLMKRRHALLYFLKNKYRMILSSGRKDH